MKDKEFLLWLYKRLVIRHGENPQVDYMLKLRAIVDATDQKQETPIIGG